MSENNIQDFDRLMKSMLEDAEVKAPRSVWRNVSSKIGAAASPVIGRWPVWAGLSLAAACVAAVLFFGGKPGNSNTIINNADQALAQAVEPCPAPESGAPVPGAAVPDNTTENAGTETVRSGADRSDPADGTPAGQHQDGSAGTEVSAEEPVGTSVRTTVPSEEEIWTGIVADNKPEAFRTRVSLALDGSLGGNDSEILANAGRVHRLSHGSSPVMETGITETSASTYGIPLSFGIGARIYFAPKFSAGIGVNYSLLTRTFAGTYNEVRNNVVVNTVDGDIYHSVQYIGIPVNAYYDLLTSDRVKFYVYGGGTAEFCVSNSYRVYSQLPEISFSEPVRKPQFSVNAGIGVEFKVSNTLGIYIDPSAHYYFHCDQPKSVRTDKPFMINLEAGLRINL